MARPVAKTFEQRVRVMAPAWNFYIPNKWVMHVAWLAKLRLGACYRSANDIDLKAALKAICARGCLDPDAPVGMIAMDLKPDLPPDPYQIFCTICGDQFESPFRDLNVCSESCLLDSFDRAKAEYQASRGDQPTDSRNAREFFTKKGRCPSRDARGFFVKKLQ